MSNPLKKIWELVRYNLPEEELYKTLEVHYYPNNQKLEIGIFYTKNDLFGRRADDYFLLDPQEFTEVALAVHSIQYHRGEPIYSVYSKGYERFLIYQIGDFYLYTKDKGMSEISITPYPKQIILWAEDWREGLNPKEEIGLILINTVIDKIKRTK